MTVNYTTNLALGQPVTGTESGTWGDDVNNSVTSYLDIAIAGGLSVSITATDVTLTLTQGTSSATNIGSTTAQYAILNVSGAMTAARNLILPSSSRQYVINNNTTGGFALTVKGSATSGVTMVNGEKAHVFWNGSDYAKLSNTPGGAGTFSSITNTGLTSGRVVYSTTGGLETDSANLTFDGTNFATTGTASAAKLIPTGSSVTGNGMYLPAANALGLSTNGTNAVYIDSSQNVGIGTSSPSTKLHVAGSSAIARIDRTADASLNPELQLTAVARQFNVGVGGATFATTAIQGSYYIYDATAAAYRFVINNGGNVGIGTSSPSYPVVVSRTDTTSTIGGSSASMHILNTDSGAYGRLSELVFNLSDQTSGSALAAISGQYATYGGSYGGNLLFSTNPGSGGSVTERMRIDSSGNVGIGTSSPATRLQVNKSSQTSGDTTPSGALLISNIVAGNGCLEIGNDSSANGWIQSRNITSASYYDLLLQPGGGNVGIGTSSPSSKLSVVSTGETFTISGGGTGTQYQRFNTTGGNYYIGISSSTGGGLLGGASAYSMCLVTESARDMIFGTNNTERVRIESGGNVGIGTSSPSASAILDAQSTTKGVRMPNMTTTQKNAISSPAAGLMVFDTTLAKLCVYSGSAWQTVTSI